VLEADAVIGLDREDLESTMLKQVLPTMFGSSCVVVPEHSPRVKTLIAETGTMSIGERCSPVLPATRDF
jgi:hypothetical protein